MADTASKAHANIFEEVHYAATACRLDGVETSVEDERMHLNGDGTGTFTLMGYDFDITWQLDGNNFSFRDVTDDEFTGTYHDGVIEGEYFGGYYYVFERTDAAEAAPAEDAAEAEAVEPVEEPAADTAEELRPAVPGVYKVVELYSNEEGDLTDSLPLLESWGMVFTLELYDDGTGVVDEIDEYAYLTWDDEYFYEEDEEEPCPYTFDGSRLRLVEPAGYTVFELME